jgi:hypothetical protein
MTQTPPPAPKPSVGEHLALTQWHLQRVDGLRGSTVARAGVVLSAAALLLAGNAVAFAQLGDPRLAGHPVVLITLALSLLMSTTLVVVSMAQAAASLITLRESRDLYARDGLPLGLLFNGGETLRRCPNYASFVEQVEAQSTEDILQSGRSALWIGINQYRRRYRRLRQAARSLYWGAGAFVVVLTVALAVVVGAWS